MNRLEAYRRLVDALLRHATNGSAGRDEDDPVYVSVVEGRDYRKTPPSSSCGDLPHWLLYRLGVRESWVNRKEHYTGWRVGQNISCLSWRPSPAREMHIAEKFWLGDILVIWKEPDSKDSHALVVVEHVDGVILSADYGQPGGKMLTRRLSDRNLGGRYIQRVLTLGQALTGTLAPPDWTLLETLLTGEELDACAQAIGFPLPPKPLDAA